VALSLLAYRSITVVPHINHGSVRDVMTALSVEVRSGGLN
jgi:hypothetical protein